MKQRPFGYKLFIMFASLLTVLTFIFTAIMFVQAGRQSMSAAMASLNENSNQVAALIDGIFYRMDVLSLQMTASPSLQEYYQSNAKSTIRNWEFQKVLNKVASQFVVTFEYNTRMTIYCPDGSYSSLGIPCSNQTSLDFFSSETFPQWYEERNRFTGYTRIMPPEQDLWSDSRELFISFLRKLFNSADFSQVGIIEVQISPDSLSSAIEKIRFEDASYSLCSASGSVILSNDEVFAQEALEYVQTWSFKEEADTVDENSRLLSGIVLPHSRLLFLQSRPASVTADLIGDLGIRMILIMISLVSVFLVLIFFLIRMLTRPLRELQQAITQINPPLNGQQNTSDELSFLRLSFDSMKDQLNRAVDEAVTARTQQEHAQFQALSAQINPHFTFNAISVISSMALQNDEMEIYGIASAFSDMLRYILSDTSEIVPLQTELTHCEAYLKIMRSRYESQLDAGIDCPGSLYNIPIPKLSLQPLLENSFKHGFAPACPPYVLTLHVKEQKHCIEIIIEDNGMGMPETEIIQLSNTILRDGHTKQLQGNMDLPDGNVKTQLGIRSSYIRIHYLYPDASINLASIPGSGFRISISFTANTGNVIL